MLKPFLAAEGYHPATKLYDTGTGRYTLHCGFQRPWLFRNGIAETTLKIPENQLRLVTDDIGGSYGLRGSVYPEIILMLWAARRVGRPVKWLQTRNEAHISDDDARDNIVDAALALDRDGRFLAVKIRSFGNLGAFVSFRGAMPPAVNIGTVCGVYLTPALHVAISGMCPSRQAAFFGPTVANGALRTWLNLQLAPPLSRSTPTRT